MNILLWVLQAVLAFLCVSGGIFQIFKFDELKKGVVAMRKTSKSLWAFLGAYSCIAGIALILPSGFGVYPIVTAYAAIAMTLQSLFISVLYIKHKDRAPLPYSLVMAGLAAFIAYGRFI